MVPQLVVTTHSSHILDAVEFEKVRYFRRCALDGQNLAAVTTLNASNVLSLRDFKPQKPSADGNRKGPERDNDVRCERRVGLVEQSGGDRLVRWLGHFGGERLCDDHGYFWGRV